MRGLLSGLVGAVVLWAFLVAFAAGAGLWAGFCYRAFMWGWGFAT